MLTEVKNQIKVMFLSVKYNIMRQMVNKVTFITNIIFMILNNAAFIIQWIILFSLKDEIGGYTIKEVILLWGIAASIFGFAHILFHKAFDLSDLIIRKIRYIFSTTKKCILKCYNIRNKYICNRRLALWVYMFNYIWSNYTKFITIYDIYDNWSNDINCFCKYIRLYIFLDSKR